VRSSVAPRESLWQHPHHLNQCPDPEPLGPEPGGAARGGAGGGGLGVTVVVIVVFVDVMPPTPPHPPKPAPPKSPTPVDTVVLVVVDVLVGPVGKSGSFVDANRNNGVAGVADTAMAPPTKKAIAITEPRILFLRVIFVYLQ